MLLLVLWVGGRDELEAWSDVSIGVGEEEGGGGYDVSQSMAQYDVDMTPRLHTKRKRGGIYRHVV